MSRAKDRHRIFSIGDSPRLKIALRNGDRSDPGRPLSFDTLATAYDHFDRIKARIVRNAPLGVALFFVGIFPWETQLLVRQPIGIVKSFRNAEIDFDAKRSYGGIRTSSCCKRVLDFVVCRDVCLQVELKRLVLIATSSPLQGRAQLVSMLSQWYSSALSMHARIRSSLSSRTEIGSPA
jgi:hypothetical protein